MGARTQIKTLAECTRLTQKKKGSLQQNGKNFYSNGKKSEVKKKRLISRALTDITKSNIKMVRGKLLGKIFIILVFKLVIIE